MSALPKELEAFIEPMISMCRGQFPRECHNCGKRYEDFGQFVRETTPQGAPTIPLDTPVDPIGMISWTNCACGSTLVIHCVDDAGDMHRRFMSALTDASKEAGGAAEDLLLAIRAEVRRRALRTP